MKLVIVESPAKAKTIEKFLGKDYKVTASYGHIRDLPGSAAEIPEQIKAESWSRLGVNPSDNFSPVYIVPAESKKRVSELKKMLKDSDELILATDEDREGESISWHLLEVLNPKVPVKRIAFHEITKSAIQHAVENPREVDSQLVRAQESRRILDRLYGYTLSPVLWKKVRTKLSAGRVQSVALRLIVEREEERQAFISAEYWDVDALFKSGDIEFTATLSSVGENRLASGKDFDASTGALKDASKNVKVLSEADAKNIALQSKENVPWTVTKVERKQQKKRPSPPFITSTLQQAASSRLNLTPRQTMMVAQRLYEGIDFGVGEREGLITYMRTDSLTLSGKALHDAQNFIIKNYGQDYHTGVRPYKSKSKNAQEAHEAIRPTEISRTPESLKKYLKPDEYNLYKLIWQRTVASQMADAILSKTAMDISVTLGGVEHVYRANGSIVDFPGFLRVYGADDKDTILPELSEGQKIGTNEGNKPVILKETVPQFHKTIPPARFTEASLVKKLEEEGIGRPSTYAPTISTIQNREYVTKKNGYLIPTYVGIAVIYLLRAHFQKYIDYKFTALMEQELDDIANGQMDWIHFLDDFYHGSSNGNGLLKQIEHELPNIVYPEIPVGKDPETGKPIVVRIGRNSCFIQRGEGGDGDRASLPVDLLIDELTPEKALNIIESQSKERPPIGKDDETGLNIYVLVGPYGPYLQVGEVVGDKKPKRIGLPKGTDLDNVDMELAHKLLSLPRDLGKHPETGRKVIASTGMYGPYIKEGNTFKSIGTLEKLFSVTLDEAVRLFQEKNKRPVIKVVGTHPESGKEIEVLKGRYGPYITDGEINAPVPNGTEPEDVTVDLAVAALTERAAKGPAKRTSRKKTTAKKTTVKKATAKKTTRKNATAKSVDDVDVKPKKEVKKVVRRPKAKSA